jgi:hypothetical protein
MTINYSMIRRIALRVGKRKHVSLYSLAKETITLCPQETVHLSKAIYLDGSLEKIAGLSPWRNWEQDNELIYGGDKVAYASCAYILNNVDIVGAYLYAGAAKSRPGFGQEKLFLKGYPRREFIDNANLVTTYAGSLFFGPLLVDDFPLELNAKDPDENIKMITRPYHHEADYRKLLGLHNTRLVQNARIKQLTLYEEPAINSLKKSQYKQLRGRLRKNYGNKVVAPKIGVYLKRGSAGEQRMLQNENEIESLLTEIGFDIVEPAKLSVDEIVTKTLNAKIVVSIEGSHMSHVIFTMADNGVFVVLQPPDRFSAVYKEIADCIGIKFAFIVGDNTIGGFTVKPDDLRRILDLLD